MNKSLLIFCTGLTLLTGNVHAQWENWGMPGGYSTAAPNRMPWSGQGYARPPSNPQPYGSNFMPWGGNRAPVYQAPPPQPQPFGGMMPWGGNSAPRYSQPPPAQPFGGGMMPWNSMAQPQPRPQSQPYMMPGMDQGIRSMMQPGKIMAEEATPGMYMKPTWR